MKPNISAPVCVDLCFPDKIKCVSGTEICLKNVFVLKTSFKAEDKQYQDRKCSKHEWVS